MTRPIPILPKTAPLKGSVIIVSRHRPGAVARCITALRQQSYRHIEVIVVADPQACAGLVGQRDLKVIAFDAANISAARNMGLAQAAGDIALFIDDDAVAEPNWAASLIAAFENPVVVAATGFVRGRNGISYQWRASLVDSFGQDHPLDVPDLLSLHDGDATLAVKTQGTNCAFRLDALRGIGGFDPAFAFFLDEADVNLRLAMLGTTAIVPWAQVHHGYMASARRSAARVPSSLYDIAASTAVFLRKHIGAVDSKARARLFDHQMARVAALHRAGKIDRSKANDLCQTLEQGWQDGLARPFGDNRPFGGDNGAFHPLEGAGPRESLVIAGRFFSNKALHRAAQSALAQGKLVTVICMSPTIWRHRMQFLPQGYWWQSGGIWGRADRSARAKLWQGFAARVAQETQRIAPFRPNDPLGERSELGPNPLTHL